MSFDPEFDRGASKRPPRRAHWLIRSFLIVAPVLLLIALLLPARRGSREAARRSQCIYNLKQIGLALANYEERHGTLPPAYTVDTVGRPLHSWRTLLLPFLYPAEETKYRQIDLARPWDDPSNMAAAGAMPGAYGCPSARLEPGMTTYLAVVGPDACFLPARGRSRAEITSDPGSLLTVIEAGDTDAVPWMAPRDADADGLPAIVAKGSRHPGGTNAAFIDGSVRFLKKADPAADIREMGRINPDETKRPAATAGPGAE